VGVGIRYLSSWSVDRLELNFTLHLTAPIAYNRRVSDGHPHPISATTRYCAVYGHPIKHSASPAMQNAGIAALGLDWRYLAFEVPPEQLEAAIEGARVMRFIGVNLTVPHKLLAPEMVDSLDKSAKDYGAVNTIRFEAKDPFGDWRPLGDIPGEVDAEIRSVGFNTDADGISQALREAFNLKLRGTSALVLGAGGAGGVAALRLAAEGVKNLFLVNRTASKAEETAEQIKRRWRSCKAVVGYPNVPVDLILNATSLGLRPDDANPLDEAKFPFKLSRLAYDMIYRPAQTPFLRQAKAAGCRVANGLGMLLHQGTRALEIWTGKPAPVEIMRRALEKNVYG
jgi:shikimate dehydrogenase